MYGKDGVFEERTQLRFCGEENLTGDIAQILMFEKEKRAI